MLVSCVTLDQAVAPLGNVESGEPFLLDLVDSPFRHRGEQQLGRSVFPSLI